MKNALLFLSILFFSVVISFSSFCEEVALMDLSPYSGVAGLSFSNGLIRFDSTSSMPLLMTRDNFFINASRSKFIEIRMKSSKSYATGRMFFRRIGDAGFNYSNSFEFQTGLNNIYHNYLINLGRNPNWFGTVTQVMLSPINEGGSVEIADIKFLEPNVWLMARSFWQEFMKFEPIKGVTVNTIKGKTINEISVNIYLYFASFAFVMLVIIKNFKQLRFSSFTSFYSSLDNSFREILLITLILFALLELRQAIDYTRQFIIDYSTLTGRSIDEKRALTTYGDLYEYVLFVKKHLPEKATAILTSTDPYYRDKGKYYLYPLKIVQDNSDYILVFRDLAKETKGYRLLAKLSEDQMIFKKVVR